jgi:uncharacterized protein involved in exopolysaccharide biosynthesis
MAQFIASGVVELSRSGSKEASDAMIADAAKAAQAAQARLLETRTAFESAAGSFSEDALRSEVADDSDVKSRLEQQLVDEQAGLAEFESREKLLSSGTVQPQNGGDELNDVRREAGGSRARIQLLEQRIAELAKSINEKSAVLARQSAREQDLESALRGARTSYETASQRLADLPVSLGSRMEWLRVVDPGIVPQRPSSPNVPLTLLGSVALALFGSLLYLTFSFGLTRERRRYHAPLRMATHGDD